MVNNPRKPFRTSSNSFKTWEEAQRLCEATGNVMAMPKSITENEQLTQVLKDFIKKETTKPQYVNFWIGIRRVETNLTWLWNGTENCSTSNNYNTNTTGEPWAATETPESTQQSERNCVLIKV